VTDQKNKPVLDEQTFERLLEAGYVLQEHNRKLRDLETNLELQSEQLREQELLMQAARQKSQTESEARARTPTDYTLTLAEIVEAQHQIQTRHLDLDKALAVVAERVARITGASGAGIGISEGATIVYRAGAGSPALPIGSEVPLQIAICQANLRTGQVIRTEDVDTEFLFDPEPCRRRGILSLIAVPIYHDGNIVGGLELYFDRLKGYAEQDIHTCQLMAGLVTEAIGRDTDLKLKNSMASERSTMLAAIERLQPNQAALAGDQSAAEAAAGVVIATITKSPCWKCGNKLAAEEQFCGKCGAPRTDDPEPSSMQSKLASAWQMQRASHETSAAAPSNGASPFHESPRAPKYANQTEPEEHEDANRFVLQPPLTHESGESDPSRSHLSAMDDDSIASSASSKPQIDEDDTSDLSAALVKPEEEMVWSSAATAKDFLESVSAGKGPTALARFWRSRRGDLYLAVAVILVLVVIRWGIWSNHSVGAQSRGNGVAGSASRGKQPAPETDLSAFDKFLIAVGMADAPEPPVYKGNPDTQVWVDLHTALYYCPGSELYGKTAKGKLTSQRDAQLDQFEPASRKACE
jgi:putative methionine-R-sulfoxide reductase with GAF domain